MWGGREPTARENRTAAAPNLGWDGGGSGRRGPPPPPERTRARAVRTRPHMPAHPTTTTTTPPPAPAPQTRGAPAPTRRGLRWRGGRAEAGPPHVRGEAQPRPAGPVRTGFGMDTGNDPSAGSPTETLLRLLLPLNNKVWTASRSVASGEPNASPQSGGLTGSFNR